MHGSSLRVLDYRRALLADEFGPDEMPRLAAQIPALEFALRQVFKAPCFRGIHVSAAGQALVQVSVAGAGFGGDPLAAIGRN